jgi:bifunctional enzyme CysN/CysC
MTAQRPIEELLRETERKDLLRFSTAGSIDDGKSTLIGRLLHDSRGVFEDQLAAIRNARRSHLTGEAMDLAWITDGLKAEREQGITIDVAYRYFSTLRRKFIIADTPGHEQYTRNMVTGASTADVAIVLIDVREGVKPQTKRHAFIAALLGVPHLVIAVNKMDLIGYSEAAFEEIRLEFENFARKLQVVDVRFIPLSALVGDNVVEPSKRMPWYQGQTLLAFLETVYIGGDRNLVDFRFPVQLVLRPDIDSRAYCGQIFSGMIRTGETVTVLPSQKTTRIKSIVGPAGLLAEASAPMSVAISVEDELDIGRGDMLVHRHNLPRIERHFEAMIVWMGDEPMNPNRSYLIKQTTQVTHVGIDEVRYRVEVEGLHRIATAALGLNEIGRVVLTAYRPLLFDPYQRNRGTGCFVLIDERSNATVAAGMIIDREPANQLPSRIAPAEEPYGVLHFRPSSITLDERARRTGHRPATIWITGLVASGKTRLAYALERRLFEAGVSAVVLDGENIRLGLSRELDFSPSGCAEHLRRVAEVARLLNDSGQIVICAFVSPSQVVRQQVAERIGADRMVLVFLDASPEWCEAHDQSGLYAKARAGKIRDLAGINCPYDRPEKPDLDVSATDTATSVAVDSLLALLREKRILMA